MQIILYEAKWDKVARPFVLIFDIKRKRQYSCWAKINKKIYDRSGR
jgi:hypothetical protein